VNLGLAGPLNFVIEDGRATKMDLARLELARGWYAFDLPGYRNHPKVATYSLFEYDALPPIQVPSRADFKWLMEQPANAEGSLPVLEEDAPVARQLESLSTQAGIVFPSLFTTFPRNAELRRRVRSCTGCYLLLPDYPVTVAGAGAEHGVLIHFLSDQQWCFHWHLLVDQTGDRGVVGSTRAFGFEDVDGPNTGGAISKSDLHDEDAWLCAPSFVEFVYRFWLKNEIWFALADKKGPLNMVERSYVEWYRESGS
jgi:hypothetical protein